MLQVPHISHLSNIFNHVFPFEKFILFTRTISKATQNTKTMKNLHARYSQHFEYLTFSENNFVCILILCTLYANLCKNNKNIPV